MSLEIGIVGLPNVGKSSLFNASTKAGAQASNFPFTTIEPNVGVVSVPDERLDFLTEKYHSAKTVPTTIKFVDIAGLVKGASQGEGLGNKFLSHIRSVDAIAEVVRVFDDPNVTHVHGTVNPDSDIATINTELLLADIEQAQNQLERIKKDRNMGSNPYLTNVTQYGLKPIQALESALKLFDEGKPLRTNPELAQQLKPFQFLTAKPLLYIANVSENSANTSTIQQHADSEGAKMVVINVKAELEVIELPKAEQEEYRAELQLDSGLDEVIKAGYQLLGLITFFTAGPKESHAWTITEGTRAPQAAGKIHTDFEKGFIRAQVFNVADLEKFGSEKAVKEAGKLRSEGKDYVVKDGDVVEFLFNV